MKIRGSFENQWLLFLYPAVSAESSTLGLAISPAAFDLFCKINRPASLFSVLSGYSPDHPFPQ
jgi:hypothetical protein